MHQDVRPKLYTAVRSGDIETARLLFTENPELLAQPPIGASWLNVAAIMGDIPMMEFLISKGLDINAHEEGTPNNPLATAAGKGHSQVVRWLLDHGSKILAPLPGCGGGALLGAVTAGSVDVVRLLIERGADPNHCFGTPTRNALSHAISLGHHEVAALLRSYGVSLPNEKPNLASVDRGREIVQHVEHHIGTVRPLALQEIVSGTISIRIHVVSATSDYPWVTLFTTGMSDRAMTVPSGAEEYQYAELLIQLPPDWPLTEEALRRPEHAWPIEWLRRVGYYPHENNTWLNGAYAIISNGEPVAPLAPGIGFTSVLLLASQSKFGRLHSQDGCTINFYRMFPLYTEERDFVLEKGPEPLLDLFQANEISTKVDIGRKNVLAT